jgi:multiple sugar transport system substrate-binding protein
MDAWFFHNPNDAMKRLIILFLIVLISGCAASPAADSIPSPAPMQTATVAPPIMTEEPAPTVSGLVTLKIWLPPEFDPSNGSPAGELLAARLEEFENRRSNVRIETRIKGVEGPGGMIDTLTTANAAAPLALPDLIALPQHALETAAIKGLLHPFDGLTETMEDPDWYMYSLQLSHLQDSTFGIPFAGDALIMVYRPSLLREKPGDWTSLLEASAENSVSLSFPAADQESLLTLAFYQSLGGSLFDQENRPLLDSIQLTEVLTYYQQAEQGMLMPFWLTQYETDEQSWTAYEENQTDIVITWSSRYLRTLPVDSSAVSIPTRDGSLFTLATGWAWALASPDPAHQELSAQLAEFITSADFLAAWTAEVGYIPPKATAVSLWEDAALQTLFEQVAPSARLVPSFDVLTTLGPVLQKATVSVLKQEASPVAAAESAVTALTGP